MMPALSHPFQPFKSKRTAPAVDFFIRPTVALTRQINDVPAETELKVTQLDDGFVTAVTATGQTATFSTRSCRYVEKDENVEPYAVTRTGIMKKCGGHVRTWYWRWFNLKHSKMAYYKKESDMLAIKTIKLIDVKTVRVSELFFKMSTSDNERVWEFECQSKDDAEAWIRALNQASVRTDKLAKK